MGAAASGLVATPKGDTCWIHPKAEPIDLLEYINPTANGSWHLWATSFPLSLPLYHVNSPVLDQKSNISGLKISNA